MVQPVTFLGSDAPPPAEPVAGSAARARRAGFAVAGAWLLAAALCALAAVSDVFSFHYLDSFSARGGYDATGNPLRSSLPGDRGPRWSIALWVLAVAFVVLGALTLRAADAGRLATAVRTFGIVACAVLIGIAAGIGLFVEASLSTSRAIAKLYHEQVAVSISACLWLVLAAVVCSLAAVLLGSAGSVRLAKPGRPSWMRPVRRNRPDVPMLTPEDADSAEVLPSGRRTRRGTPPEGVPPQVFDV